MFKYLSIMPIKLINKKMTIKRCYIKKIKDLSLINNIQKLTTSIKKLAKNLISKSWKLIKIKIFKRKKENL